jgi:hypothetical protein
MYRGVNHKKIILCRDARLDHINWLLYRMIGRAGHVPVLKLDMVDIAEFRLARFNAVSLMVVERDPVQWRLFSLIYYYEVSWRSS